MGLLVLTVAASVLLTSVLSGVFGMAGGMILMGIYTLLFPVSAAMVLHGTAQVAANGFRFALLHRDIRWKGVVYYGVGSAVAAIMFLHFRVVPSKRTLHLSLGLLPFLAVIPGVPRADFTRPFHALLCGAVVSTAQLMAGVSGPLLDLFFARAPLGRRETVATKAVTQVIGHLLKLGYFARQLDGGGLSTARWCGLAAVTVACALAGTHVGGRILDRLSEGQFRRYSQAILLAIGGVYLIRGVLA